MATATKEKPPDLVEFSRFLAPGLESPSPANRKIVMRLFVPHDSSSLEFLSEDDRTLIREMFGPYDFF